MSDPAYAALRPQLLNATDTPLTVEYFTHDTRDHTRATFTLPPGGRFDACDAGIAAPDDSKYPTARILFPSQPPMQVTFRHRADRWKVVDNNGTLAVEPDTETTR